MLRFVVHPVETSGRSRGFLPLSTIVVIPARYESSRLPGKALADIAGRPMIEHVYRRAAAARSVDAVIIATDDDRIRRAAAAFGADVRMTSPSHASGTDRVAEVAGTLTCDLVVNVQGDEPLLEPAMIDEAVAPFAGEAGLVMSTLYRRIDDPADLADPNVPKVVVDQAGYALYFSRAPVPFSPDGRPGLACRHIGLYVYRRPFLLAFARLTRTPLERAESLEQLRALEHGYRIRAVETAYDTLAVDTEEHLERVRRLVVAGVRV